MSKKTVTARAAMFALFAIAAFSGSLCAQAVSDGDKDGVPDSIDDCPYTPAGAKVDSNGCALDEDFDGVADGLDRCPRTALGAVVDAEGCSKDQVAARKLEAPAAAPASPATSGAIDPFSTQAPAAGPIQGYPLGEAPTQAQIDSGTVAVPSAPAYPTVPDQVRAELDAKSNKASASGKTVIQVPVRRDAATESPAPALPEPVVEFATPPAPAAVEAEPTPPPAPVPQTTYVETPTYLYQRPIKTASPPLSTAPVTPIRPRTVIPPSDAAPLSSTFGGGPPVDPLATPLTPSAPSKSVWSVTLAEDGQIGAAAEQELRVAADTIKQAQRENPDLSYEVAGAANPASSALSFLASQGVAISRLRLKTTAATNGDVVIRPASE